MPLPAVGGAAARIAAQAAARLAARKAAQALKKKKKGRWFQKVPKEILTLPGGVVLVFFAGIMELIDLIPIPLIDQVWELPLEILFIILLKIIAKVPFTASVIPFIIERIPVINDTIPTWFLKLFLF